MPKISAMLAATVLTASLLPGCILPPATSTGGSSASALGPDGVLAERDKSTLPERIKSGVAWLWASYARLHDAGAAPGLDDLKADILDIEAVVSRGDLLAALDLYKRARARVTAIAAVAGN